jgi:hypothetical protein
MICQCIIDIPPTIGTFCCFRFPMAILYQSSYYAEKPCVLHAKEECYYADWLASVEGL